MRAFRTVSLAVLLSPLCFGGEALAQGARNAPGESFASAAFRNGPVRIDQTQCAALPDTVWVAHRYGTECVRYYPSPGIKPGDKAVFYFSGDWLAGNSQLPAFAKVSPAMLYQVAKRKAEALERPFIFVARPGLYGSSGDHTQRRRPKEFYSLNAAVDAIKAKYQLDRISLVGQAGGATTVAALLTLGRTDVDCAVGTSGNYAVMELAAWKFAHAGPINPGTDITGYADSYDVINHLDGIRPDPARRIFVIGDPEDKNSAFQFQQKFADALKAAGQHVTLLRGDAPEPENHDLVTTGYMVTGWCASGMSDTDIAARVIEPPHQ